MEAVKDAVARDQCLRILSRRRAELDQACDDYQLALEARMHELEDCMEVKEVENVGAEQEEDKEVEEPRIDKVEVEVAANMIEVLLSGGLDPGEGGQMDANDELECGAAKDDVLLGGGALDPGEGDQIDANDELVCRAAKDDVLQGGGAIDPGEGDQSDANDELECGAAKDDFWQGGGALDPGEGDCVIGAKVKVEKIDVYKVRAEEFANLEVLRAGQLDPGEVRGSWKEVPWLNVEVQQFGVEEPRIDKDGLEYRDIQDELEFRDAKKELQELRIPESNHEEELNVEFEPLRFVKAGCRALGTNSEYG